MTMVAWTAIVNAFGAIKEYFGWASKRSDLNNAPDVRAADIAAHDQAARERFERDTAARDVDATRNELSE